MGMPAVVDSLPERDLWTVEQVWALPRDGNRYEVLYGELLVTPLQTVDHQRMAAELARHLGNWAVARGTYMVLAPGGVYMTETSWLEPDIAVYPVARNDRVSDWRLLPPPVLAVEVLSSATRVRDRSRKRPAYLAHGVGEVWLVDGTRLAIERWTAASGFPTVVTDRVEWSADDSGAPFRLELVELFGTPE
jgi:Uma2 family endonuclease